VRGDVLGAHLLDPFPVLPVGSGTRLRHDGHRSVVLCPVVTL
jgi:hypothetical protein